MVIMSHVQDEREKTFQQKWWLKTLIFEKEEIVELLLTLKFF